MSAQLGSAQKLETMASALFSPFKSRFLLASTVLLLFIPPIFSLLVFFWPLIVSTVLGVLAVVSFGQHGISTGQEEEISEDRTANPDMVVPSTANMEEEISDVLMVGNEEVTWLEWLHKEDMQKCRAQERASCMSARWDLDELNVTCEASLPSLAVAEEKSMANAYPPTIADESSANEQVVKVTDAYSTAIPHDGIWVRTQVENKKLSSLIVPVPPVLNLTRMDANGHSNEVVDVMKTNVRSFKVDDAVRECVLADKAVNMTQKDGDLLVAEVATEANAFTMGVSNGSKSGYVERDEMVASIDGQVLALQDKSAAHAFVSEVRDASTSLGSLKLALKNETSECTFIHADGEHIPLSLTSKAIRATDASRDCISFTSNMEAMEGHKMRHIKKDAKEQDSKENKEGPIWDVSDEEDTKSSLRFSFFDNGCLPLTTVKHEAEGRTLHT